MLLAIGSIKSKKISLRSFFQSFTQKKIQKDTKKIEEFRNNMHKGLLGSFKIQDDIKNLLISYVKNSLCHFVPHFLGQNETVYFLCYYRRVGIVNK